MEMVVLAIKPQIYQQMLLHIMIGHRKVGSLLHLLFLILVLPFLQLVELLVMAQTF
jgi:hypothetical protein